MKQDVIILVMAIILVVILFGTTVSIAVRAKGLKKAYWLVSSFLLGMGSLSFIYFLAFPEPDSLSTNRSAGEVPPELLLAGLITRAGIVAALLGFIAIGLKKLATLFSKHSAS